MPTLVDAAEGELDSAASESILERADTNQLLARIDLHSSEARHAVARCEEDHMIVCDPNFPYRHADGRCNNLQKPTWGKANTCFARLLPPDYSDGQGAPRISVTGHPLPNPRILSAIVHRDFNYPATYTHFVMQYGQFFAHDIAFTPSSRTSKYLTIRWSLSRAELRRHLRPRRREVGGELLSASGGEEMIDVEIEIKTTALCLH